MSPLVLSSTVTSQAIPVSGATSVDQVIAGSTPVAPSGGAGTGLAFITYNGNSTGASLPFYVPGSGSASGTVGSVALTGGSSITAPVAGAFTPDNTLFFVSTAGDNKIHYISIPNVLGAPTDSKQVSPNLPACNPSTDTGCIYTGTGTVVPATVIVVKPRSTT
jgi:hypothetical protein